MFESICSEHELSSFIECCHIIHRNGWVSGPGGNVSIRVKGGFLITGSGIRLEAVSRDNIVFVKDDGSYEGNIRPSKELLLHQSCYKARDDINSVVHVHSIYSVALSCISSIDVSNTVPMYTPGFAIRIGHLPAVTYYTPGSTELADETARIIRERNSVLLCNHGLVTVGKTSDAALNLIEEIEENIKIYFLVRGNGKALTDEQVRDLEQYIIIS